MGGLFYRTLDRMFQVLRQNVVMIAPPPGDTRYGHELFPAWIDHGYPAYGIPAAGGDGFKAVINWRQLDIDLDRDDRLVDQASIARTRRYVARRFPGLDNQPISGIAVGQIATTADTHFLIDRHSDQHDVVLVADDSGHLFKHGPVVGGYVAELALIKRKPRAASACATAPPPGSPTVLSDAAPQRYVPGWYSWECGEHHRERRTE